jgi:hypothetical protein
MLCLLLWRLLWRQRLHYGSRQVRKSKTKRRKRRRRREEVAAAAARQECPARSRLLALLQAAIEGK